MIEQSFASKRPVAMRSYYPSQQQQSYGRGNHNIAPYFTPTEYAQARARKITPLEYRRRNSIIAKQYIECPFKVGDVGYPVDAKKYEKYGACKIVHICETYKDMGVDDEWPKSDNPFIMGFQPTHGKTGLMLCTSNFLSLDNRHLKVEA